MIQQYMPVLLDDEYGVVAALKPLEGEQLWEHAWRDCATPLAVQKMLFRKPRRLVWCGARSGPDGIFTEARVNVHVGVVSYDPDRIQQNPAELGLDVRHRRDGTKRSAQRTRQRGERLCRVMRYAINHDKREYVDLGLLSGDRTRYQPVSIPSDTGAAAGDEGMVPDALALLTATGNGNGDGDYYGDAQNLVGRWAYDLISTDSEIIWDFLDMGYRQIFPQFGRGEKDNTNPFIDPSIPPDHLNQVMLRDDTQNCPTSLYF